MEQGDRKVLVTFPEWNLRVGLILRSYGMRPEGAIEVLFPSSMAHREGA